ncbi:MAG TPA: alkaline shock response membrane anchor protein AmaP [Ktedonobacteraceae bacterium]|nr:alkaline shock response membrane anchor protein AmaP [Ktedonobacteraceae bacterium]
MNVFNRIVVILLCLMAIAFSIIVFLLVGGVIRPTQVSPNGFLSGLWSFYSQLSPSYATIAAIAFVLMLIVAVVIVILEFVNIRSRADHFVVREDSLGKVTVARSSVRKLVGYEAKSVPGVIETRQSVDKGRNGLRVQVRALLFPEVNAPEVGHTLQEKVQQAIQRHMGIDVTEVQVATQLDPFDKPRRRRLQ